MKTSAISYLFGLFMLILCALGGAVSAFVMSGVGMCGWVPLDFGACLLAVCTALIPGATVGSFHGSWRLPPLLFSILMLCPVVVGVMNQHWLRAIISTICIGIAFGAARAFRPRGAT
jgi:hypothetical protein